MTANPDAPTPSAVPQPLSRFAGLGFALACLAALAAMAAGFGHRWEWWGVSDGFTILRWAAYVGLGGVGVSLIGCVLARPGGPRRGLNWALLGIAVGLVSAGIPWSQLRMARSVPPIHDITTDTANPPLFAALLLLREGAPNPATYGGTAVAAQQKKAYPDLDPEILDALPDAVFRHALSAARTLGWNIVSAVPGEGRLEATDTTFWFGFKDDVVVRVVAKGTGSRVDVRSVSRVGRSDVGANARRIRAFLKELRAQVAAAGL